MSCPFSRDHHNSNNNNANTAPSNNDAQQQPTTGTFLCSDPGMLYGDYLLLDQLLSCQEPVTRKKFTSHRQVEVHDEHLFIITHQAYELWFKQIIYELDSVHLLLNKDHVEEVNMLIISSRLNRIKMIFNVLTEQFRILLTMTPLDFMDFRDYLAPASGFQSFQFRLIEHKLGIRNESRINYKKDSGDMQPYLEVFRDRECIEALRRSGTEPSLCKLIERWLERTPGLEADGFNFWEKYKAQVTAMIEEEARRELAHKLELLNAEVGNKKQQLKPSSVDNDIEIMKLKIAEEVNTTRQMKYAKFESIFSEEMHRQFVNNGNRRFSHKALQGALLIFLYRDEPRFSQPYQLLVTLMDIDDLLISWRQDHAQMVLRMIGNQTGTGGSSGYNYLSSTTSNRYKIFLDLSNLSTFLVPKAWIPKLSDDMRRQINSFHS